MRWSTDEANHHMLIHLEGIFNSNAVVGVRRFFGQYLDHDKDIVINMDDVESIDLAGVRFLDQFYRHLLDYGCSLILINPNKRVAKTLETTHLGLWISSYATVDSYLARHDHTGKYFRAVY